MPESEVPEELRLIQEFVNTHDVEEEVDELADPSALARWLEERGLPGGPISPDDLARAREFREALRTVLLANNHKDVDAGPALEFLDRIGADAPLRVRFRALDTVELSPSAGGIDAAFGRMLGDLARAIELGTWHRLKACAKDSCQWAFYDRSKNQSGRWCAMRVCGNRVKASTYRARHATSKSD